PLQVAATAEPLLDPLGGGVQGKVAHAATRQRNRPSWRHSHPDLRADLRRGPGDRSQRHGDPTLSRAFAAGAPKTCSNRRVGRMSNLDETGAWRALLEAVPYIRGNPLFDSVERDRMLEVARVGRELAAK